MSTLRPVLSDAIKKHAIKLFNMLDQDQMKAEIGREDTLLICHELIELHIKNIESEEKDWNRPLTPAQKKEIKNYENLLKKYQWWGTV